MRSTRIFYSFTLRIKILSGLITLCLLFLIGALFQVQVLRREEYRTLSQNNRVRRIYVPAQRGKIYDRKGVLLVDNRPAYNVEITREEIRDKTRLIQSLSRLLGISGDEVVTRLDKSASFSYMPKTIRRDLDDEQLVRLEESTYFLPGVDITVSPVRSYICGAEGAHVFGAVGKIPEGRLDEFVAKGYNREDTIGKDGLEFQYEDQLRGHGGGMQVQVDSRGLRDQVLGFIPPVPGRSMVLTLDNDLQHFLCGLFEGKIGAGVVMNYQTGEVLAMGSFPSFDPNVFIKPLSHEKFGEIFLNVNSPLTNRAISGLYPPGSVFKPIVALAALEAGTINENTSFFCGGEFYFGALRFRCWKKSGHGRVTVVQALKYSCNVFLYNTGMATGQERIYDIGHRYHLGMPTGIDLPGEKEGVLPNRAWKKRKMHEDWYGGETINYAIGQGYVLTTPLQICVYTGGLACGQLMVPHVLSHFLDADGNEILKREPKVSAPVEVNGKALSLVHEGMRCVVQDPDGTGRKANIEGLDIRGKTGTAQFSRRGESTKCTWFTAFIKSDTYPFVVTLLVEEGISGGTTCAPMVHDLIQKAVDLYKPAPVAPEPSADGQAPAAAATGPEVAASPAPAATTIQPAAAPAAQPAEQPAVRPDEVATEATPEQPAADQPLFWPAGAPPIGLSAAPVSTAPAAQPSAQPVEQPAVQPAAQPPSVIQPDEEAVEEESPVPPDAAREAEVPPQAVVEQPAASASTAGANSRSQP